MLTSNTKLFNNDFSIREKREKEREEKIKD